jgi:hypothetical protein
VEALVIAITLTLDGVVLKGQQPEKVHRIGLLIAASNVIAPFTDAFRQGLGELGYVEGNNYILEVRGGGRKPIGFSVWRLSWSG